MSLIRSMLVSNPNTRMPMILRGATTRLTPATPGCRCYCASSFLLSEFSKTQSPYAILGVSPQCSLDQVKQAFIKLALQTHPDRTGGGSSTTTTTTTRASQFVRIRAAFEAIQTERNSQHGPEGWSGQNLQDWWQQETGEFLSFQINDQTRQEVIQVFRTMGHSAGRDKGGYWEMARQLAEREDAMNGVSTSSGTPVERPLGQLQASSSLAGVNRRRRRTK